MKTTAKSDAGGSKDVVFTVISTDASAKFNFTPEMALEWLKRTGFVLSGQQAAPLVRKKEKLWDILD